MYDPAEEDTAVPTAPKTAQASLRTDLARDLDTAFPRLVTTYQDGIYSGVRRLLPTAADAEDITQDTFVRAYGALRTYPPERVRSLALAGWLWTIALNLCRNAARTRSRRPQQAALDHAPEPEARGDAAGRALAAAEEEEWAKRLATLSPPIRAAVVLRHVSGLSYGDIAAALDRPVGTVKADVHRGLMRLRQLIEAEEER